MYSLFVYMKNSKAMEAFSQQAHLISQNCDNYFRNSTYVTNRFLGRENLATSGYFHLLSTTTKVEVKTEFCLRMNFVGGFQKSSSTCTKTELTKWFRRATVLGGKAQWRIACGRRVGGNRPMRSLLSMSEHHWAPIRGQSVPSVWTLSINKSYLICRG